MIRFFRHGITSLVILTALFPRTAQAAGIGSTAMDSASPKVATRTIPVHENTALSSYRVESDIELEVTSGPLNGSCSVSILRTDSLLMTFQGPFGLLLGKLSACPASMLYFDALRTEVLEGDPRSEALAARMPIPLYYNDIVHLMRCEVPYASSEYKLSKTSSEDSSLVFSFSGDERFVDFAKVSEVDGSLMTYQRKSRSGEVLMNIKFSEYKMLHGVSFPRKIVMNFPARNTIARFSVTDVVINPIGEHYTFVVPKGIKRTTLE